MNLDYCITAMNRSLAMSRQALQVELAVGLAVYHHFENTGLAAKKAFREIYAAAGQVDCLTSESRSYQTVNRRMDRIAKLFDYLGRSKIRRVIGEHDGMNRIEALITYLEGLHLDSMDDVLNYVGEPRQPSIAHNPHAIHIVTAHVHLDVLPDASKAEIKEVISKLMALPQMH